MREGEDGGEDKYNPGFYSVRGGGLSSTQLNGLSHSKHGKAGQGQGRANGGRGPTFYTAASEATLDKQLITWHPLGRARPPVSQSRRTGTISRT